MDYQKFLSEVIKGGIKGAKRDYRRVGQKVILKGSIAGFEACRNKNPIELAKLLEESGKKSQGLFRTKFNPTTKELNKYWEARGFTLEVEWVCNVVSAMLMNEKKPTIIPPTARGMIRASEIVGVAN